MTDIARLATDRRVFHLNDLQILQEITAKYKTEIAVVAAQNGAADPVNIPISTLDAPDLSEFILSEFNFVYPDNSDTFNDDSIYGLVSKIWLAKTEAGQLVEVKEELRDIISDDDDDLENDKPFYHDLMDDVSVIEDKIAALFDGYRAVIDEATTIDSLVYSISQFAPKEENGYLKRTNAVHMKDAAKVKVTFIGKESETFDHIVYMSTDIPDEAMGEAVGEVLRMAWRVGEDPSHATIVITFDREAVPASVLGAVDVSK